MILRAQHVTAARGRSGFTLLELLLASLIAAMLLSALYFALNMTLEQTQSSRESADGEDLSRAVFNRIAIDLSGVLGPLPPKLGGTTGGSGSGTSTSTSGTGTTGTTGTTTPATGDATADPTDPSDPSVTTDPTMGGAVNYAFASGILGRDDGTKRLVIFASRVPDVLTTPGSLVQGTDPTNASAQTPGDLYRIVYWISSSGRGLCREARPWITANGIGNTDMPDMTNEAKNIIADEVVDLNFEYWDGTSSWLTTWNGQSTSASGSGMAGPPKAIRVTLTFEFANPVRGGDPIRKTYQQVIPVRTAPGAVEVTLVDPVMSTDTTQSSMGSGSGSGSGSGGKGGN